MSHNRTKILAAIAEAQAIQAGTVTNRTKPSVVATAGNSLFGNTSELRGIIAQIRTIEASNPALAKFPQPKKLNTNNPYCKKKDVIEASAHLAKLQGQAPRTAPRTAPTSRATAPVAARPAIAQTLRAKINSEPSAAKRQALRLQNWQKLTTK